MSGKRRKFTPEFWEQAARLVIETGRPVAYVAAAIGVGEALLGRWVRLARQRAGGDDTGAVLDADEHAELQACARKSPNCAWTAKFLKKAATSTVTRMCELLDVSRSGYDKWRTTRDRGPTPARQHRTDLDAKVAEVHMAF